MIRVKDNTRRFNSNKLTPLLNVRQFLHLLEKIQYLIFPLLCYQLWPVRDSCEPSKLHLTNQTAESRHRTKISTSRFSAFFSQWNICMRLTTLLTETDHLPLTPLGDGSCLRPQLWSDLHISVVIATLWKLADWDSLGLFRMNVPKQLVTIEATAAPSATQLVITNVGHQSGLRRNRNQFHELIWYLKNGCFDIKISINVNTTPVSKILLYQRLSGSLTHIILSSVHNCKCKSPKANKQCRQS